MEMRVKDYLSFENERNKKNAKVYVRLLELAFGKAGRKEEEMVGHHISFEFDGDIGTMNEIPSADTLLFDHDIMKKVFGKDANMVMMLLAIQPAEGREEELKLLMKRYL